METKQKSFMIILDEAVTYDQERAIQSAISQIKGVKELAQSDLDYARNELRNKMLDALGVAATHPARTMY